uniref:Uncharacterized protein n=1 Tax=viral metagenome TaxID=1070528 RepID=A0A6C0I5G7_9ZZZZ
MDDFSLASLQESRNEWCARLINILAPMMSEGVRSIFDEAWKLCEENNETSKYLMTFQNFLSRVPKWNANIIAQETQRIVDRSGCGYLADLVTCVHIIQLKSLTCMRVGSKQKKVDIDVPQLNEFIHKVYTHCARKLYTNVYLFERGIPPLSVQKNGRELEIIIKECVLDSIRDSIPLEMILKTYMDETIEDHTEIKIKEEIVSQEQVLDEQQPITSTTPSQTNDYAAIAAGIEPPPASASASTISDAFPSSSDSIVSTASASTASIKFNDVDSAIDANNAEHSIHAPKTEERLEQISNERYMQRKLQEEEDDDGAQDRLKIGEDVQLDMFDVHSMEEPLKKLNFDAPELDDIEILA